MFQVINKTTGLVVCESFAYAPLEQAFEDSWDHQIVNVETGVRWDVGFQTDEAGLALSQLED